MNPFKPYVDLDHYGNDAHPERPWWRVEYLDEECRRIEATRRDDVVLRLDIDARTMATVDRIDPLPCPPPMVGQVWTAISGPAKGETFEINGVTASGKGWSVFPLNGGPALFMAVWDDGTPPDAVLVDGPSAPWAPADWSPDE